jgi:hypothetical protein
MITTLNIKTVSEVACGVSRKYQEIELRLAGGQQTLADGPDGKVLSLSTMLLARNKATGCGIYGGRGTVTVRKLVELCSLVSCSY